MVIFLVGRRGFVQPVCTDPFQSSYMVHFRFVGRGDFPFALVLRATTIDLGAGSNAVFGTTSRACKIAAQ
jgi:hypothetical protein